jgi:hypothetical protein
MAPLYPIRTPWLGIPLLMLIMTASSSTLMADDFQDHIQPVLQQACSRCHGGEELNAEIDLTAFKSIDELGNQPELIQNIMDAVSANNMPPDGEPPIDAERRAPFLNAMKSLLRRSVLPDTEQRPLRRLNRFQYNYAVKDLFQLKSDVFPLTEKLMTRHTPYLATATNRMPDQVQASSLALAPAPGLRGVQAFPKDLRAAHGFDNQANQLTLSPLLLDAFLKLSISIVESPDFNEQNVGTWGAFFAEPAETTDLKLELRQRINHFLTLAFRMPPDAETLERYVLYAQRQLDNEVDFATCMKKVASAALSSPLFLYRKTLTTPDDQAYRLASDLSFFFWSSGPDQELLQLAASGQLLEPATLQRTVDRMMSDPKMERFLDSFPTQWLQLEGVLAATPDPQIQRAFSLDKNRPASLQMLIEPLLLFDAAYVENRPIIELIAPEFSYQSDFLKSWYTTNLQPEPIDLKKIETENRQNEMRRQDLQTTIDQTRQRIDGLLEPVKRRLLQQRQSEQQDEPLVDLKPVAAWEFDGELKDSVGTLDLTAHGEVKFEDGLAILNQSYLISETLPFDLKAKTLEVWLKVQNLDQSGGGAMGIQGPSGLFDTIVLGERKPRHWISGSDHFNRTDDFAESTPETAQDEVIHLVMVYLEDGTTQLYRNGIPYGQPFKKDRLTFQRNTSQVIFGLRHLPAGGNRFLNISLDRASLYDRALTAEEVIAASRGNIYFLTENEILEALAEMDLERLREWRSTLAEAEQQLSAVPPPIDPRQVQQQAQQSYDQQLLGQLRSLDFQRVAADDPRYGGIITNAAMLSMTSGPKRTHPIARGAWVIEVVFNDPPPPPPNDVPPLKEDDATGLTIRERFAKHREVPSCAGCHSRLDPLGFALENFDITGRWRDTYAEGLEVDASGTLMRQYDFKNVVDFKQALVQEQRRFAVAFTQHLLRFALTRELTAYDTLSAESIVDAASGEGLRLKDLVREVALSRSFTGIDPE